MNEIVAENTFSQVNLCARVCVANAVRLRLVGTEPVDLVRREGRLEVYYNGVWGSVCDHSFSDTAAKVACNALGFGYVTVYY